MLYCMNPEWMSAIINVEGIFIQGRFENGKELYIEVPGGYQEFYKGEIEFFMNIPLTVQNKLHTVFSRHLQSMSEI